MSSRERAMTPGMTAASAQYCGGGKGGKECRARRLAGSDYCFFHDPDKEAERKAAQRAGGQKNKMAVLPSSAPDAKLRSADDAVKLLAETINQVRRGELDPKIANAVGYLAGLLMKGLRESETERRLAALESAVTNPPAASSFYLDEEDMDDSPRVKQNGQH